MMKKIIKILTGVCITSLFFTSFIGCSKQSSTTSDNKATQDSAKPKDVTMRFSWWGNDARHKATLAAIDLYKQKNPNVNIEAEYSGIDNYYQKLVMQLSSATAPDIIQVDVTWIPDLANQGEMFVNLYDAKNIIDTKGFDSNFLKQYCEVNGKLQGLPAGLNGLSLFVNKKFMEQAGIPLDTEWTWEKILEEGKKIHEKDKSKYLLMHDVTQIVEMMLPQYIVQKTGGQFIKEDLTLDFDKAVLADTYTYFKSLYDNGVFQPLTEAAVFEKKTDQNPKYVNGDFGLVVNWSSSFTSSKKNLPFEIFTTRYPYLKDGKEKGTVVRPSQLISINKKSANSEEAEKFLNWLFTDKDAVLTLSDVRSVPVVDSARKILNDANKIDPEVIKSVDTALKNNSSKPQTAASSNSELQQILKDNIQKLAFGVLTPDKAAEDTIAQLNSKIKEIKDRKK